MILRVNGLFGWVRANDRRSLLLFGGFVLALNFAAILALFLPLAAFDPGHAPFLNWTGYLTRYVPLVTVGGAVLLALQMAWHVRAVQKLVDFRFVDDTDESRLCRIVENLAIGMGLPAPYVGVIETAALNAFACGTRCTNAALVVTRGLIDGLDDDELGAVVAHELSHIADGDIRFMAAANACLRIIDGLIRRKPTNGRVAEFLMFPMLMLLMPPAVLFVLIVSGLAELAFRAPRLIRLMIVSAREFIADAAAVQATQNPAALVSALRRIDGRSALHALPAGHDAMMIDGPTTGALATHPTIERRIAAIVAVTGSMALIAPSRRDTRPGRPRTAGFGRAQGAQAAALPAADPCHRADAVDSRNRLGLTPTMGIGGLFAIALLIGVQGTNIARPAALFALLDPRPFGSAVAIIGRVAQCDLATVSGTVRHGAGPCAPGGIEAAGAKLGGPVGALFSAMLRPGEGEYRLPDGGFSNVPPPGARVSGTTAAACVGTARCPSRN